MFKKVLLFLVAAMFVLGSTVAVAQVGSGKVTAKSTDIDISIFGSLKTYPHFISDVDFNDEDTGGDWILDESGIIDNDEVTVRNEFRLGFAGKGKDWSFMTIFEGDFALDKGNGDRGARSGGEISNDIGMTGEDFGIEKLEFTYDFTSAGLPVTVETGWNTKWLDIETGGLLYGDDHPYIGLKGDYNGISWEYLTLFIYDDVLRGDGFPSGGLLNADDQDWTAYTFKFTLPVQTMKLTPFYAYSDMEKENANVHYFGIQTYGKLGMFTPRAEFVYANGEKDNFIGGSDADINAFAAFAALEYNLSPAFNPYIGGYWVSGDDDANDDDIEAFNPITNISRYTPTFGMENAIIYRLVPNLGTHLYSNVPDNFGSGGNGYGGISDASSAESPGMYTAGLGVKGTCNKWAYKTQFQYFWLEETGALEDVEENNIDDALGWEFDLQLTYNFNQHFSLGNVISVFDPGDAIEDIHGSDYDETAIVDTIELKWSF